MRAHTRTRTHTHSIDKHPRHSTRWQRLRLGLPLHLSGRSMWPVHVQAVHTLLCTMASMSKQCTHCLCMFKQCTHCLCMSKQCTHCPCMSKQCTHLRMSKQCTHCLCMSKQCTHCSAPWQACSSFTPSLMCGILPITYRRCGIHQERSQPGYCLHIATVHQRPGGLSNRVSLQSLVSLKPL